MISFDISAAERIVNLFDEFVVLDFREGVLGLLVHGVVAVKLLLHPQSAIPAALSASEKVVFSWYPIPSICQNGSIVHGRGKLSILEAKFPAPTNSAIREIELLKDLLSRGVPVDSQSESLLAIDLGCRPLHSSDLNGETEDNVTPLLLAVVTGYVACLELLVKVRAPEYP
ncbi:unnamed protein product [Brassica rapa]|uniref:Uncharacterized protein n=1 Tax=Brassica campestris TaxID=3711 RepID=A0A8D9DPA4_BRACM|nr:unnamed protein product [Brassica rapa]